MSRIYAALCLFIIMITAGIWGATQSFAKMVEYHAALGAPLFISDHGTPVYWPFAYLVWYIKFRHVVPNVFVQTFFWLYISFALAVVAGALCLRRPREENSHGTARWATGKDLKKAGLFNGEGIIFGKTAKGEYLRHNGPEHVMAMAPTRSGKGVGIIIPTLFLWPHSVIVTDIKGEGWGITAGYRQKYLKNKVIKLEPTATDGSSARFNPFDEIRLETEKEVADVQNIANIIMDPQGKGNLDHWGLSAQNLLVGAILHLKYVYRREASLSKLVEFFSDPERGTIPDILYSMLETEHDAEKEGVFAKIYGVKDYRHPIVGQIAQEMLSKPERELGSIVSSAMAALFIYRDPVLARNTSASDFTIRDLMNHDRPVSLYLVVPPSDIDRMNPVFRLTIELILRRSTEKMEFRQGAAVRTYKHRLLLLLDEFPALGRMDTLERALAYIAGYGLKALLITQSLNQLNKTYTKENNIMDNCHIRVFFTPNDASTPEYISKMLGKRTEVVINRSTRVYEFFHASRSTTNVARDLMTPGEVSLLKANEELVFVTGFPPIKAYKIFYYKDNNFKKRCISAPQKSDVITRRTEEKTYQREPPLPKGKPIAPKRELEKADQLLEYDAEEIIEPEKPMGGKPLNLEEQEIVEERQSRHSRTTEHFGYEESEQKGETQKTRVGNRYDGD